MQSRMNDSNSKKVLETLVAKTHNPNFLASSFGLVGSRVCRISSCLFRPQNYSSSPELTDSIEI